MQRTADSVIASFTNRTMAGEVIPADEWLLASSMLNVLIGEEVKKLYDLQCTVAKMQVEQLNKENMSVAKARLLVAATEEYKALKIQEAFILQIREYIRIAKKMCDTANTNTYQGNGN